MNLLDPLRDSFGIIDMKAEMIHAGGVTRLFRIGGIQDCQIYFTVREMHRAVFGAVHFL